jgi:hypothetical protein
MGVSGAGAPALGRPVVSTAAKSLPLKANGGRSPEARQGDIAGPDTAVSKADDGAAGAQNCRWPPIGRQLADLPTHLSGFNRPASPATQPVRGPTEAVAAVGHAVSADGELRSLTRGGRKMGDRAKATKRRLLTAKTLERAPQTPRN